MLKEEIMFTKKIFAVVCFVAMSAIPAVAESVPSLRPGEAIIITPQGRIAVVKVSNPRNMMQLKPGIKPLGNCSMFMAAADGSVWMVNTDRQGPVTICEELAY
jgi:hypothetical protein